MRKIKNFWLFTSIAFLYNENNVSGYFSIRMNINMRLREVNRVLPCRRAEQGAVHPDRITD